MEDRAPDGTGRPAAAQRLRDLTLPPRTRMRRDGNMSKSDVLTAMIAEADHDLTLYDSESEMATEAIDASSKLLRDTQGDRATAIAEQFTARCMRGYDRTAGDTDSRCSDTRVSRTGTDVLHIGGSPVLSNDPASSSVAAAVIKPETKDETQTAQTADSEPEAGHGAPKADDDDAGSETGTVSSGTVCAATEGDNLEDFELVPSAEEFEFARGADTEDDDDYKFSRDSQAVEK